MPLTCLESAIELARIKKNYDELQILLGSALTDVLIFDRAIQVKEKIQHDLALFEGKLDERLGDNFMNKEKMLELGIEEVEILACPAAQKIIDEVVAGLFDFKSDQDKKTFYSRWKKEVPNFPMPATLERDDFLYLEQLARHRIVEHYSYDADQVFSPNFGKSEILFIDTWIEEDNNALTARSVLMERLGFKDGKVLGYSRKEVEEMLWESGDTIARVPTARHRALLEGNDRIEFRLIRQDEYARLAQEKGWGKKYFYTHFEGYWVTDLGDHCGLIGGHALLGGASRVECSTRNYSDNDMVVRLVLAKKKQIDRI